MLHQPVIRETPVADGVGDVGIPEKLLNHPRLPRNGPIAPVIHELNSLAEDFQISSPKSDISF